MLSQILNKDVKIALMKLYQTSTPRELYYPSTHLNNAGDISITSLQAIESGGDEVTKDTTNVILSDINESPGVTSSPDAVFPASVSRESENWIVPSVSLQKSRVMKTRRNDASRRSNRSTKERFIIQGVPRQYDRF